MKLFHFLTFYNLKNKIVNAKDLRGNVFLSGAFAQKHVDIDGKKFPLMHTFGVACIFAHNT